MEHGAGERIEKQSHSEMTIKIEVEETVRSTAYNAIEINVSYAKEEPGLVDLVKSQPGLSVEEEVLEDGWQAAADSQRNNNTDPSEQCTPSQLYSCDKCAKTFTSKTLFERHSRYDHLTEPHKCTECNKDFSSEYHLYRHASVAHSKQQYECAVCKKIFKSNQGLSVHISRLHRPKSAEPRIYNCNYCQKTFAVKHEMKIHITRVHASGSYKCNQCQKYFKCVQYLLKHTANVHTVPMQVCNVCGKSMKSNHLKQHMLNVHSDKQLQCKLCGKSMAKKYLHQHLKDHHAQHSEGSRARIYTCDYCQKVLTIKSSIINHITRLHTRGSYKCNQCDKSFKCKQYLVKHTANVHTATMKVCNICGKSMKSNHLKQHVLNVHSDKELQRKLCGKTVRKQYLHQHLKDNLAQQSEGSRVYICDLCQKSFAIKTRLLNHIICLHGTGSYKCSKCIKTFKCEQYLTSHMTNVHNSQRRICNVCGKSVKPCHLRRHMRNIHGEKYLGQHLNDLHCQQSTESHQQSICRNFGKDFNSKRNCDKHEESDKCTRPTTSNKDAVPSTSIQQHNVITVKEEPTDGELELGPVVFQHMDCNYRPYEQEPRFD